MFDDVNLLKWLWGLIALVVMFGGLFAVLHALKRQGFRGWQKRAAGSKEGALQIVDTLNLDLRRSLVLVDDGTAQHLILLSPQAETCISSTPHAKKGTV